MNFLYHYYRKTNKPDAGLALAEKQIFKVPYLKKYRLKYFLKKKWPALHDLLVKMKKRLA
jgi:hypothetical protein